MDDAGSDARTPRTDTPPIDRAVRSRRASRWPPVTGLARVSPSSGLVPAIRQIVLATDLGPASAAATTEAFRLAAALDARLLAVSVIDPRTLQLPGGRFRSRIDQERARLEAVASELVLRGRRDHVPTSFLIWEGDPAESIVDAARSEGADVIVVGSHGRGALGRALIGSVSDQVVRRAPCPVLVVRSTVGQGGGNPG